MPAPAAFVTEGRCRSRRGIGLMQSFSPVASELMTMDENDADRQDESQAEAPARGDETPNVSNRRRPAWRKRKPGKGSRSRRGGASS